MTTVPALDAPRSPYRRSPASRPGYELITWVFMRMSGVLLVVLVLGHLFVNLVTGEGVNAIDFAFVGGKWASPFWQVWDLLMLWLAFIHGGNGMRTIVNDYATRPLTRKILLGAVLVSVVAEIVLGTVVIFAFDPCPVGGPADLLPSFCPVNQ